ncbi:MAG: RsbRD N-terminal domain-containing protein [Acidobacteria bacterium]|nr:RsbRD N-terminal domain-containing protein [Acidobacteriota bacterium]MCI0718604.1 RsbRD N-terminal domain-containing protein [Acidobacteriota bacterium]
MNQAAIANLIKSHIGQLIENWTAAVRDDPRIQSDENLSKPELIDHVPAIIEEICELIRKSEMPGIGNSLEARANVYVRFHQGYTGRDLIRELSLLRITLLDYLMEISSGESPGLDAKQRHDTATIINLYLDEEMRYAISVFCGAPTDSQPEPTAGDR